MSDAFITKAGPAPARSDADRWHQVALLGVAAATSDAPAARIGLAAALLALDCPLEAGRALAAVSPDEPWGRWWGVIAVGQTGDLAALGASLHAARAAVVPKGPDGRDVARLLADLDAELAELAGNAHGTARFGVLGHRARPERRALIGGRSSAAFLVDPTWDALRVVRLAPSDGPSARNAALLPFGEVLDAVRRGDAGPGRPVPGDAPAALSPSPLLDALREDPAERDGRLLRLATEVREERRRLTAERERLAGIEHELEAERAKLRRAPRPAAARASTPTVAPPKTKAQAAALLGLNGDVSVATVNKRWRELVATCHPDRVEGLHPLLRERARDLAVALNTARDLLVGPAASARSQRG